MKRAGNGTVLAIEALIRLFRESERWNDYCGLAGVSAEDVLRERWIRNDSADLHCLMHASDDARVSSITLADAQLSRIESDFLKDFVELGRSGQVTTKHRIIVKHHPTTKHSTTPCEMFERARVWPVFGEVIMQSGFGPTLKLVEINDNRAPVSPRKRGPKSELKLRVEAYYKASHASGAQPTIADAAKKLQKSPNTIRPIWKELKFPIQRGGHRKPTVG